MGRETMFLPAPPTTATTTVNPVAAPTAPPTSLAPGFRFHPTDEELVIYYLKRKVSGKAFRFDAISEVDIYRSEPWDLADKSRLKTRDQEWYFFSALDKKYGNGGRMNRATSKGYWKATGNDRPVRHEQRTVGLKKTLVFHSGRAPDGKRTNWVMHEYRLMDEELERAGTGSSQPQDAYVLCRVFHKNNIGPPNGQRYAPFIEEEWDDATGMVPGAEPVDNGSYRPRVEGNRGVLCAERRNDVVQ
ncbi:NAC domain-containing protein 78, partial [Mucuna pruriens]